MNGAFYGMTIPAYLTLCCLAVLGFLICWYRVDPDGCARFIVLTHRQQQRRG